VRSAFDRSLYCGGELPTTGDLRAAVLALVQLRELLVGAAGADLDQTPFWALVERLAGEHPSSLVRGGAQGLRYAAGRIDAAELGRATAGHLAGASDASDAVGYAQGLLLTARESAWQDTELMPQLDALLGGWDEATFVAHLPDLRLAFADLTPRETDRVARLLASLHGLEGLGPLQTRGVDEAAVARHLQVSREVAELLRADRLGEWVGAA
jgi:hypothetical protein